MQEWLCRRSPRHDPFIEPESKEISSCFQNQRSRIRKNRGTCLVMGARRRTATAERFLHIRLHLPPPNFTRAPISAGIDSKFVNLQQIRWLPTLVGAVLGICAATNNRR